MIPHFYLHPGTYDYDFGPQHPLKPERLTRTMALIEHFAGPVIAGSDLAADEDLVRVHSHQYLDAVKRIDEAIEQRTAGQREIMELRTRHGFWGDNPPFCGNGHCFQSLCRREHLSS